jgi:hypothetical protein
MDLSQLVEMYPDYFNMEIRDGGSGDVVWRSNVFSLPLEGASEPPVVTPAPLVLPDLVDHDIEKDRRETVAVYQSSRSTPTYRLFENERISIEEDSADLGWLIRYAERESSDEESALYNAFSEIRDAKGDPVWRSARFPLPTYAAPPPVITRALPELDAADLAAERRERAEAYGEFVAFRGDASYTWGSNPSLVSLVDDVLEDMRRNLNAHMFEIRDAKGDPVWRSENFDAPLQGAVARVPAALPELANRNLVSARRIAATSTGDPFVAFRGPSVDHYGSDDSLIALVESITNEPTYATYDWEIRNAVGDPVWRSSGFGTSSSYLRLADILDRL